MDEALLQREFYAIEGGHCEKWKELSLTVRYIGLDSRQIINHTMAIYKRELYVLDFETPVLPISAKSYFLSAVLLVCWICGDFSIRNRVFKISPNGRIRR